MACPRPISSKESSGGKPPFLTYHSREEKAEKDDSLSQVVNITVRGGTRGLLFWLEGGLTAAERNLRHG